MVQEHSQYTVGDVQDAVDQNLQFFNPLPVAAFLFHVEWQSRLHALASQRLSERVLTLKKSAGFRVCMVAEDSVRETQALKLV